jgi:formylglycine-generating enzyme required for sulfatase activity/tRNA A-37 threonylcarbamoyl transferase component Bud32
MNNYKINSELGRGGMATVYLAHDIKFDTHVAVKVLNKEYVHNDNIRKRFLAEARNMFRMSHPNIIKVTDLIDDGDTVAFVMEYIEGETLKEYLERKGKLSDDEIKLLFTQMLDAVGYVHEQNLVHRDIKPSNFMLDKKGKVKLMDFGIAKNTDANSAEYTQTGTGMQMGTPMYMSPEQVKSSKEVGPASDIYSLGVVLWQMVSGRKPYNSNTLSTVEIHIKILQDILSPTQTIWDSLIEKATQKDFHQRYAHAAEFKQAIEHINVPSPVSGSDKTVLDYIASKKVKSSSDEDKSSSETNLAPSPKPQALRPKKSNLAKKVFLSFSLLVIVVLAGSLIRSEWQRNLENETTIDSTTIPASPLSGELAIEWANIPAGTFTMGSPQSEAYRRDDETQHEVTLDGFKMSKYEVTFTQYDAFCDATGRSKPIDNGWGRGKRPVINVSWDDAKAFAAWAGAQLPTEAQWEYACRAGSQTPFNTGGCLSTNVANYDGNYPYSGCNSGAYTEKTMAVGSYAANSWGLHNMHGNVWEWCADWYSNYPTSALTNPQGPSTGSFRMVRGGSLGSRAQYCRSAYRGGYAPDFRNFNIGFRLVSPK